MTGIFPISKTIESDINKFAPSPSPLPRGERVRERVVTESIYTGTNNISSLLLSQGYSIYATYEI